MRFSRHLFAAFFMTTLTEVAFAFDKCETFPSDPVELSHEIAARVNKRAPVKYHPLVPTIKLVTSSLGEKLSPFADEQQGKKFIVLPPLFAKVACQIALAQFLRIEGIQEDAFDQASKAAANCFDAGGSQKSCIVGFANELARRYGKAFAGLPVDKQQTAFGIYAATLHQIMMHEYAHHFLDHFARIKAQKLTRADAEFEADLFAVMNGVQAAEPASAMYYFFQGIADVERHTEKLATPDYESGYCRASNVDYITRFIQDGPMLLVDSALGGGYVLKRNSPSYVRSRATEVFSGALPALDTGYCGRIAKVALGDASKELRQLYGRMETDLDFLFAKEKDWDVLRANRLLSDLAEMSEHFRYMDGIAVKSIALMLRGWGLKGRDLTPLIGPVDRLLDTDSVTGSFLSEDFGRLLQAHGMAILQEPGDNSAQWRMDRSFSLFERAVSYNPSQSEAWMNLAFIAFKRGDCAKAARFADRAVETLTQEDMRESTQFFASKMNELSPDPKRCRTAASQFHPYPGL